MALGSIGCIRYCQTPNLVTPEHVRRLAWDPPAELTPETVTRALAGYGARPWQTTLLAADLTALADT